ncbi:2-hydroxychromene-2-carboxylate isomerase [Roseovarius salinarum]|uniref:2-hydroxychromene-2-carboxylate isomerase n=1 Tax=Roseovarius salinarum TaxID=1981892 RepID=UPI000C32FA2D|nr:2-hydroxychromene-2-carboxylate isomerase [Roseovarius salinarum]
MTIQRPRIELWFEFASTYSYLTVMRAGPLLEQAGVELLWRPFLLGPIFQDKGMPTSPFVIDPVKGAYMWRDVARRAERYGLAFRRPPSFPANGLSAARIMTAALNEPWCGNFARAVFRAQFQRGEDISDPGVLETAITDCGQTATPWLEKATTAPVKARLRELTNKAREHGIFGAPSFVVSGELFWGDDRLEDAIEHATRAKPYP